MQGIAKTNPKIEKQPGCVAQALCILGNKWTALIVMQLASGPQRFLQLENSLPGISPRTLSQRLDDLEASSIITKKNYTQMPPRVDYTLTNKGKDLIPILKSMAAWGSKHPS